MTTTSLADRHEYLALFLEREFKFSSTCFCFSGSERELLALTARLFFQIFLSILSTWIYSVHRFSEDIVPDIIWIYF
jgi:hypothetical protein